MSMTETPTEAPKPKRKVRAKRAAAPRKPSELAWLTANDCCTACNAAGCVISGRPYCGHPFKGGLQGADLANEAAITRLNAAKKMLGKSKVRIDKF